MKLKGPKSGRDYWAIVYDYLKPEVTEDRGSLMGFSSSEDGLNWPVENAQLIDVNATVPAGQKPWVRVIRTPHQLVDEGDGTYTVFFTAYGEDYRFQNVGRFKCRLTEDEVTR
jgi:hypothetical protein